MNGINCNTIVGYLAFYWLQNSCDSSAGSDLRDLKC